MWVQDTKRYLIMSAPTAYYLSLLVYRGAYLGKYLSSAVIRQKNNILSF